MKTTRDQVLQQLRERGQVTTSALAETLGISGAAVRRHLDLLRAEGLVNMKPVRHGVGRPSFVFSLSEAGEELAPASYTRLLTRVVDRLVHLSPEQVSGRRGPEVLGSVFEGVALDVARAHRERVTGRTLAERVEQASAALRDEGIVDAWQQVERGFRLSNHVCPYRGAALTTDDACRSDRLAIQLLLNAPVEQVGRIAAGDPCCEYVVVERARRGSGVRKKRAVAPAGGL